VVSIVPQAAGLAGHLRRWPDRLEHKCTVVGTAGA